MESLHTRRLHLLPLQLEDAPQIQQKFPQWEIVRYLDATAVPWPYPADGGLTFVRDIALPGMLAGHSWFWSIRHVDDPEQLIGVINLNRHSVDNRGFWLCSEWQRKGLITEASEAVTDFWFLTLQQPQLRVTKAAPNAASSAISRRSGMRLVACEEREFVAGCFSAEVWLISREEWLARR